MKIRHLKTIGLAGGCSAVVLLARPSAITLAAGGALAAAGEALRIWATGHLIRNQEVTTSGPYAFVRDPLYLGRLLLLVGLCVMAWGYSLVLLPFGLGVFFYSYMPRKHRKEMTRLEGLFGEDYRRYAVAVRSLLPRLTPWPNASRKKWSFAVLWRENREQYFLLIVLGVATGILLRWKMGS